MTETVAVVDEEAVQRSFGGRQLQTRPLTKKGEGGEPIFGVSDLRLSLEVTGD
jgi:hypothetical protein